MVDSGVGLAVMCIWFFGMMYLIYVYMTESIGHEFRHQGDDVAKKIRQEDRRELTDALRALLPPKDTRDYRRISDAQREKERENVVYWLRKHNKTDDE